METLKKIINEMWIKMDRENVYFDMNRYSQAIDMVNSYLDSEKFKYVYVVTVEYEMIGTCAMIVFNSYDDAEKYKYEIEDDIVHITIEKMEVK